MSGTGAWLCAEIPRTRLHLTLVPPATAFGRAAREEAGGQERAAAMRRLRPFASRRVTVSLLRYHVACVRAADDGANGGGSGRGGRGRSGLPTPERQVGFWEVGALVGVPDELQYDPQRQAYHVTDTASLIGCAPREAHDVLRALRRRDLAAEWEASVLPGVADYEMDGGAGVPLPPEVAAEVRFVS